jgi:hypothetical protein
MVGGGTQPTKPIGSEQQCECLEQNPLDVVDRLVHKNIYKDPIGLTETTHTSIRGIGEYINIKTPRPKVDPQVSFIQVTIPSHGEYVL